MRIALIVTDLTPPRIGGISKVATELAYGLVSKGHDVEVFCLERSAVQHEGAPFLICPIKSNWTIYKDYPVVSFSLAAFKAVIARHAIKPFDVSHGMNFNNYGLTFSRKKMTALGLAHVSTGFETTQMEIAAKWQEFKTRPNLHCLAQILMECYLAPWQKCYLGWGDVITTEDVETREGFENMGLAMDKVDLIPSGIDLKEIEKTKSEEGLPEKWFDSKRVWLCPGRVDARKGSQYLIRAFSKVLKSYPDLKLVFAGGGRGDYIDSMQNLVNELKVNDSILFTGRVAELGVYYKNCEAVVIPSLSEGIPITLQEALAYEKPVLCSRLKGTYYYGNELPSVLWAKPGCVNELEQGLMELAKKQITVDAIKEGFEFIKKYDWSEVVDSYLKSYARAKSLLTNL